MELTYEEKVAKEMFEELCMRDWDEAHAAQVEMWMLQYYLSDEYDYAYNLRIARAWIEEEVKEYERLQRNGCCVSEDMGLSTHDGQTIRVGFNHGLEGD